MKIKEIPQIHITERPEKPLVCAIDERLVREAYGIVSLEFGHQSHIPSRTQEPIQLLATTIYFEMEVN